MMISTMENMNNSCDGCNMDKSSFRCDMRYLNTEDKCPCKMCIIKFICEESCSKFRKIVKKRV